MLKRKIIVSLLFLFYSILIVQAQLDTVNRPSFFIYGSSGLYFLSSEKIKDAYNSNSGFIYSAGIQFGDLNSKLHSFIEYSAVQFNDSMYINNTITVVKLKQKFVKVGLIDFIPMGKSTFASVKAGLSFVQTQEDLYSINNEGVGFYFAVGMFRKITEEFYYHLNIGYDYRKIEEQRLYGDYGGFRAELGLYINLMAPSTD